MTTREIVEKYHEYVNAGNWEGWLSLFDENAIMDETVHGRMEGIERLREAAHGLETGYSKFQNIPVKIIVEGNRAVVVWHIEAVTQDGGAVDAKGANYLKIENGKIKYMANYLDPAQFDAYYKPKK
ncbi:MAG: hypothetical protein BA867_02900 [Desulfobacterales bacterium S5133MH16]|nr:MAG: hypothetical protein BA867_02900 [Desulfobacterales bacterium S5133MH16]